MPARLRRSAATASATATTRATAVAMVMSVVMAMATIALLAGAPTAVAATPQPVVYAALGDSFSAGVGTGRYDLGGGPCLRRSLAYPQLWALGHQVRSLTFLACSGARTSQVRAQQVPHVPRDADLVTVTTGGNDIGFSPVLGTCTLAVKDSTCTVAVRLAEVAAATLVPVQLATTLVAIRRAAPHARIVVLGYPRLFEPGPCRAGVPDAARRKAINDGTDLLNGVLARTSQVLKARFVDVRDRFAGHGVCAPAGQEWINGPGNGAESYHPTATGQQQGLLPALTSVTG